MTNELFYYYVKKLHNIILKFSNANVQQFKPVVASVVASASMFASAFDASSSSA
jgi:hypothetical protein